MIGSWLSIDGGNEAKAGRACYLAHWRADNSLLGVEACTLAQARALRAELACVVVERTQADGRLARGKTTPATMVGLAWNTAAVAYTLARGAPVIEYTVSRGGDASETDWIGGAHKATLQHRIWGALTPAEREAVARFGRATRPESRWRGEPNTGRPVDVTAAIVLNAKRAVLGKDPLHHDWFNVLDAVGVGLFHLGRVGKGAAPVRRVG